MPAPTRSSVSLPRDRLHLGSWGLLSVLGLVGSFGLLLVAFADALSREGRSGGTALFWVGLLAIVVPAAFRLASVGAERGERIGVVVITALLLYLVKVIRDPYAFTFADELVHLHNANEIVRTHALFGDNAILPVTPRYPGLETATAALASLSGLGTFGSGLVVAGAAHVLIMLALYLLFELLSGSGLVGGLAALAYAANPNFLYFTAQFSYESLAVPLAALVVLAAARVRSEAGAERRSWILVGAFLTAAVAVTHHLTSYALAAFLVLLCLVQLLVRRDQLRLAPWGLAVSAIAAIALWLALVAPSTVDYLTPVVRHALHSIGRTIAGKKAPRGPLSSQSDDTHALSWEYVVSIAFVALIAVGLPFGLRTLWRRYRQDPFALVLAAAAFAYLAVLPLRFVSGAWEVANRSSAFLFVGVAFLLPLAGLQRWQPPAFPQLGRILLAGCAAVVFAGGAIAGWPSRLRLAGPYRVSVDAHTIGPPGLTAARWSRRALGRQREIAADTSNGRLLLAYGDQYVFVGKRASVSGIIQTPELRGWQVRQLRRNGIRYVLVDRRRISWDARAGYFFNHRGTPRLFPAQIYEKFDRQQGVSRVFDSGDIAVYDVTRLERGAPPN